MKIGILGLPQAGKSTLFQTLTRGQALSGSSRGEKIHLGSVAVPDPRLEHLRELYHPKKFTPAKVDYVDAPAIETKGRERGALSTLTALRDVDAYALVLRAFEDPSVPHVMEAVDPARDAAWLKGELLLEDLAQVERRLERIEKALKVGKKPEDPNEFEALKLTRACLESERPASSANLNPTQERTLRGFQLLSSRPWIFVVNADDEQMKAGEASLLAPIRERLSVPGTRALALSAKTEAELAALSEAEAREFMAVLGIEEPGLTRMIRICFEALGLLCFFTVGPDEVRAWTLRAGSTAPEAAGAIHSDLMRGFIRAEVIAYEALAKSGTMAKAREQGLLRTEGRDYRVQDGDIVNIRFSV
ncbi:MAG: redox-regulated ATPase YchF [Candidatus Latescibacteria bacterium]|nr:redox-regulated ATPase YchF [Candidatus Latescibacterota bacterium]